MSGRKIVVHLVPVDLATDTDTEPVAIPFAAAAMEAIYTPPDTQLREFAERLGELLNTTVRESNRLLSLESANERTSAQTYLDLCRDLLAVHGNVGINMPSFALVGFRNVIGLVAQELGEEIFNKDTVVVRIEYPQ